MQKLTTGYVSEITEDKFIFKEVKIMKKKRQSYYTVVFLNAKMVILFLTKK